MTAERIACVVYTPDPATARARAEEGYGPLWPNYIEVRYSDPVNWTWDEVRWLRDPLYRAAVTWVVRCLEGLVAKHQ